MYGSSFILKLCSYKDAILVKSLIPCNLATLEIVICQSFEAYLIEIE